MKKFSSLTLFALLVLTAGRPVVAAEKNATNTPPAEPPVPTPYLTAAEEAKTFVLPDGYNLELVVGDPIIKEPVAAVFDGDGKMYVAEMRSYMQDIDGKDERAPVGRISVHWSSRHNGVYDKHKVFADKLILPRMILPVADGLLVNETDNNDVWLYKDTNGDGVADKKQLVFNGGTRGGNLEHQQSGLIWDMDNWIYMTVNAYRLRLRGTNMVQETTPSNGGQWGVAQDNYGQQWWMNAGGEIGPLHFQQPIIYGAFKINDEMAPGYTDVWPLVGLADVQGGLHRFRPEDKTLNHFTATCGSEIFRGDRLPEDARGDLFFAEPVGRLIRRTKIEVSDGVTHLRNAYEKSEFIRSTDPNFRPVNMVNAPDGTLYIVDMYRGIIQEGKWVEKGSYLRPVVQQHELEKNFGRGRIWRLVHDDFKLGPEPRLQHEKPKKLVKYLEHPNGWWRDTAQKLLVLRGDKSVVPALTKLVCDSPNHLTRIHALWTLEGLGALDPLIVRMKLADDNPQVRIAAIRVSESLYKAGDKSLVSDVLLRARDSDPSVVIQVMMTANLLLWPDSTKMIESVITTNKSAGVQEIGHQLIEPPEKFARKLNDADKKMVRHGETIYRELCFTCHGNDGRGMPVQGGKAGDTMAPALKGSSTVLGHPDEFIAVVLKGRTGPVGKKTFEAQMVPMESNDDDWIASVASYVRHGFGNNATLIQTNDVARVRAAAKKQMEPWTEADLKASFPQMVPDRKNWKLTASDNKDTAPLAVDGNLETRYSTDKGQAPGMWFKIELPKETLINEMELDAANAKDDSPRGYKVELSTDGKTWGSPVATGKGDGAVTEIKFTPAKAKFIRITQTGSNDQWWSINELKIFQPAEQKEIISKGPSKPKVSAFE